MICDDVGGCAKPSGNFDGVCPILNRAKTTKPP